MTGYEQMEMTDRSAETEADGAMARLASALAGTREFGSFLTEAAPAVLGVWAGEGMFRRGLASVITKLIEWGFSNRSGGPRRSVAEICADPAVLRDAAGLAPRLAGGLLGAVESLLGGMESLPPDERRRIVSGCLERARPGGTLGRQLGSIIRIINGLHEADPVFFSKLITPHLREWIEATDFGELKECVDSSSADAVALLGAVNEELWRYPAKVVCILSILPSIMNMALDAACVSLAPLNRLAPDLLADVVLSLMREADGKRMGALINEATELLRKLFTGSELIGEQGRPRLPEDVAGFVEDAARTIDVEAFVKARAMTADALEQTRGRLIGMLVERPELLRALLAERFDRLGRGVRRFGRGTDCLERALSDEDLAGVFTRALGAVDAQELASALGRFLELLNRVHDLRPGLLAGFTAQVIGSLDGREVGQSARWLMEDLARAVAPIAPEVVPPVMMAAAELIAAAGDGDDMLMARTALRKALCGGEE